MYRGSTGTERVPQREEIYRIVSKAGQERWVSHTYTKIYEAAGELPGMRGSLATITAADGGSGIIQRLFRGGRGVIVRMLRGISRGPRYESHQSFHTTRGTDWRTGARIEKVVAGSSHAAFFGVWMFFFFLLIAVRPASSAQKDDQTIQISRLLAIGIKTERLISSHTSYEFGNTFPPYQSPLSRLEFPLDSWWGGAELRATFPRLSVGLEALTNMSHETDGRMKDSDWDDEDDPDLRTIYSESECRLEQSYMVNADIDLKISDWLGLPDWLDLRPVAGVRWQNFNFVTHDGVQYELGESPIPLPGDGISFEQTYSQYFLGMRAGFDFGKPLKMNSLALLMQFDWAYVGGHNKDHHLLREGVRYTYEETYGHAWHGSVGLKAGLLRQLSLGFEADFLSISTEGSHRLVNGLYDIDLTWTKGVKAWSRQTRLAMTLQYVF